MMKSGKLVATIILSVIPVFLVSVPAPGQEHEPDSISAAADHRPTEHEFHRNHFGGLIGVSTHLDNDDSGFTLGLEYARQFSLHWALGAYTELVSSNLERDVILAVGGIFYPIRGVSLVVAPGVEFASKDVEHHGEVEQENETEFLLRLGAGYGFQVTSQAGLGPVLLFDRTGNRWTLVFALGMVVGF